ncbi:MAG: hypothetical protein AB7H66_06820 [Hyphomonadaceae bacterium]
MGGWIAWRNGCRAASIAALLVCATPGAVAQGLPSSVRSSGLTQEEEAELNRRVDYSAEQARIQSLLANQNEREARVAIGQIFAERAWASLGNGQYQLAARYALAGSRVAPENESAFRAVLGRILFDANDSIVLSQSTRNSNFDSPALAAFSPDGSRIVVGSGDGMVRMYDGQTYAEISAFQAHYRRVGRIVFSADGSKYATVSWDGVGWVFSTRDGAQIMHIETPAYEEEDEDDYGGAIATIGPDGDPIIGVGFTPDGARLLTTNARGVISTWDIARAREVSTREARLDLDVHGRPGLDLGYGERPTREDLRELREMEENATHPFMREAVFSPDGALLASIDGGGDIQVFRVRDGREVQHFDEREGNFWEIAFSPDSRRLLTGLWGHRFDRQPAKVWDIQSGAEITALRAHRGAVLSASYSSDGRLIATGSADRTVRVWEAASGRPIAVLRGHNGAIDSVSFSGDGRRLVTVGDDLVARVWNSATGREIAVLQGAPTPDDITTTVQFSQDGRRMLAPTSAGLRIWDVNARQQIALIHDEEGLHPLDWSPQGDRIVGGRSPPHDGTAVVVPLDGGPVIASIDGHHDPQLFAGSLSGVDFSPDGTRILTAGYDAFIRVWDAATGHLIYEVRGPNSTGAHFSPDGRLFVVSNAGCFPSDCRAQVRDATDGRLLFELRGHTDTIVDEQFDATSGRIVTAAGDGTARIWDAANGREILALRGHESDVAGASFSPDGAHVLTFSYDSSARLWDASSGREVTRFVESDGIHGAAFAPDGATVALSLPRRGVLLWDVSRFTQSFATLVRDACQNFLTLDQQNFSAIEVSSDPLLREAWLRGAATRSVCVS